MEIDVITFEFNLHALVVIELFAYGFRFRPLHSGASSK
jgi:hypothetical protein